VTRIGRKPKGPALVDGLECSDTARERLRQILRATSGEATVVEVCAELGIGESRFHQLRDEVLQAAAECLEPRPAGRPAKPVGPSERRIGELELRNRELTRQLEAERLRYELAVIKSEAGQGVKKTRSREALPAVSRAASGPPSKPQSQNTQSQSSPPLRAPSPSPDAPLPNPPLSPTPEHPASSSAQPPNTQSPNLCSRPSSSAAQASPAPRPPETPPC